MQHCPDQYFSMKEVENFIPGQVWGTSKGTLWRVTDEETAPINFNGFYRRAVTLRQGANPAVKGKKMVKAFDDIGLSWGIVKSSTMPFDHPYLIWNQTKIIINGVEFVQWAGGESPVSASSRVEVIYRSDDSERLLGCEVNWTHTEHDSHVDVVAYRIVTGE